MEYDTDLITDVSLEEVKDDLGDHFYESLRSSEQRKAEEDFHYNSENFIVGGESITDSVLSREEAQNDIGDFSVDAIPITDFDELQKKKVKKVYHKYTHKGSTGQVRARLSDEKYKGILVQYDENSLKCIFCEAILHPSTTSIQRHVVTPKHVKNVTLKIKQSSNEGVGYSSKDSLYTEYREPVVEDNPSELVHTFLDSTLENVVETVESYRPNPEIYERIDELAWLSGMMKDIYQQNHAIHDTLTGSNRVETYEIYKSRTSNELFCLIKFGGSVNGYLGVVHGGITAAMFDNTFGWLLMSCNLPVAFTANLNVNYRDPIYPHTFLSLKARLVDVNGRKIIMDAIMENCFTGKVVADATTLFIVAKKS